MATAFEELQTLKALVLAGKGNEMVHIVRVDQDRQRKRENKGPKPQVRFVLDCTAPDLYKRLYREWDRILLQIINKPLAIEIVIWWLKLLTPERIVKKLAAGHEHQV
jgi:hypothetical protein